MRLIDADALKRRAITVRFFGKDIMMVSTAEIDDAPTIDAVSVVRCKDCRYWNSETNGCKRNPSVEAWYETDFCKYGERQCNYFGER